MFTEGLDWARFFSTALWAIWRVRNNVVFNHSQPTSQRIWSLIKLLATEDLATRSAVHALLPPEPALDVFVSRRARPHFISWTAPDEGWTEFNVDGALSIDLLACCGKMLRDSRGRWIKGFCRGDLTYHNVFLVELSAIQSAVEIALGMDLQHVIVESDALEAIHLLSSENVHAHPFGSLAASILRMQRDHGSIVFQHTPREANSLGDYLAGVGYRFPLGTHLLDSPFGECHKFLALDLGEARSCCLVSFGFEPLNVTKKKRIYFIFPNLLFL